MKAHDLYKNTDPDLIEDMFRWMRDNDRNLYKTSLASLASVKKLRPVFLQKKSVSDQIAYMRKTLSLRTQDLVGEHLFQVWFMKGQQDLLRTFCDRMEIEHDGNGQVTGELPKELDATKLEETVNRLLEMFDPRLVTLYLHVFNMQTEQGWDNLSKALEEDSRLSLTNQAAETAKEEE
ncbi:MAG: hypothetical protein Q7Q71_07005 [Verrucomicrobiota bacterium JB023]|nr:hypothetical protein [Verrucomicrobiota bacterium JB023]